MANIISVNKLNLDPVVYDIYKGVESPVPLVVVTRMPDYEFNTDLLSLDRYILVNYSEFDHDFPWNTTPIFGKNAHLFRDKYPGAEWQKFIDFVESNKPIITLQRELKKSDATETVIPVEYPALNEPPEPQSEKDYYDRPIEVFFNWGLSNPSRPKLHGKIFDGSTYLGYSVCDSLNFDRINKFLHHEKGRRWLTVNSPWYDRAEMQDVLTVNGSSKLSVSLQGSGKKCFRTTEASVNSLMVMPEDYFAYQFPWISEVNCLKFIGDDWVAQLDKFSQRKNIYEIYRNGVEHCRKYYLPNYIKHIEKIINHHT